VGDGLAHALETIAHGVGSYTKCVLCLLLRASKGLINHSVHRVVVADVDGDDLLILNQQFPRDAVRQLDRHRMHARQLPGQGVQAQRGVVRSISIAQSALCFAPLSGPRSAGLSRCHFGDAVHFEVVGRRLVHGCLVECSSNVI